MLAAPLSPWESGGPGPLDLGETMIYFQRHALRIFAVSGLTAERMIRKTKGSAGDSIRPQSSSPPPPNEVGHPPLTLPSPPAGERGFLDALYDTMNRFSSVK